MLPGTVTCSATSPDRPADSASALTGTSPARPTRLASSNSAEKSCDTRATSAPVAQPYGTLDNTHYRSPPDQLAHALDPRDGERAEQRGEDRDREHRGVPAGGDDDGGGDQRADGLAGGGREVEDAQVLPGFLLAGQDVDVQRLVHRVVDTLTEAG